MTARMSHWISGALVVLLLLACEREPMLHLHYGDRKTTVEFPLVNLNLNVFWQYETDYDWEKEWTYGWDGQDQKLFGNIGYTEPAAFNVARYYLGKKPDAPHTFKEDFEVTGKRLTTNFTVGYYDLLAWNQIEGKEGVQSTHVDDASLDSVVAYTNKSMNMARYQLPQYDRAFYQPEELFAAYERNFYISPDYEDYDYYDPATNTYVKNAHVTLLPVTYIYLTQVRLFNNNGRVYNVDGNANLSGMARGVTLNDGRTFRDRITVGYNVRLKEGCAVDQARTADIVGGRLLTFGIPGTNPALVTKADAIKDDVRHYIDFKAIFYNGMDSTMVFDVTDQVRRRYRGGVITIDLDMDTVPIPTRPGGSGFDATVKDFEEEQHEIVI